MKKILIGAIVLMSGLFITSEGKAFAMIFSQPVKIGAVYETPTAIQIVNAIHSDGKQKNEDGRKFYEIGYENDWVAQFANGDDAIYCFYIPSQGLACGGMDKKNTIRIKTGLYGSEIKQKNDGDVKIYIIENCEAMGGFTNYVCIGKNREGKFVKYFTTDEVRNRYFGNSDWKNIRNGRIPHFEKLYCNADTIVIEYERFTKGIGSIREGEFRFKWDDKAQWFGVEQVVY